MTAPKPAPKPSQRDLEGAAGPMTATRDSQLDADAARILAFRAAYIARGGLATFDDAAAILDRLDAKRDYATLLEVRAYEELLSS